MRLVIVSLIALAASLPAQDTKTPPPTKQAAKTAAPSPAVKQDAKAPAPPPAATKQDTKVTPPAGAAKQETKAAAPGGTKQAPPTGTKTAGAQSRPGSGLAVASETTATVAIPVILRESYDYDAGGRRDPFFTLISSEELKPAVTDLRLTGVLYHPTRPIATMRDVTTNTRYTATLGTQLGRMRVIQIRPRVVIFTIEEFGLNRRDSLVLGDTTRARTR